MVGLIQTTKVKYFIYKFTKKNAKSILFFGKRKRKSFKEFYYFCFQWKCAKKKMNDNLNPDDKNLSPAEKEYEKTLRPGDFNSFVGQESIVENLKIFVH